jgi:transcriptional regulator with XRE-family HTH domain
MLGARVQEARKSRGWSLADMTDVLAELGAGVVKPGTLARMENGSRPGDPQVWGAMWRVLNLPLRELYEGLQLPVPEDLPSGSAAEILHLVHDMTEESRRLTLSFARHAPAMLAAATAPVEMPLARVTEERPRYNANGEAK